tara:strand:+ start:262 stop:366 length:105 start_codon:yes stop_codon:yes gene_type:complete
MAEDKTTSLFKRLIDLSNSSLVIDPFTEVEKTYL